MHGKMTILNNDVEKSNVSAVEKITIVLMNLLHQPISALFHQDIILHIPAVYQQQVHLMHNLIRVLFLNSFLFPTVNAEHIASTGIYINAVSVWIVFCKYRSHRIKSLKTGEISIGIYGDDRTFKMTWRAIMQDKNHHIIVKKLDGKIVSSCVCDYS